MKGKRWFQVGLVAAVALMACSAWGQEVTRWKAQTLWSAAETPHKAFEDFCKRISVLTNGRLEITPFPAGAIVPTNEALDALKANVIQAINQWPGYWTGKNPAFAALTDLPMAWLHPWEADAFFHYRGGLEMLRELYEPFGAYTVGVSWWGSESYVMKRPIAKVEDLKGVKIRLPQGMEADIMMRLGASVVVLPGGEVYSALDKGVVDMANWATPSMNERMGFSQVAKYFTWPGWHSMPVGDFTVNKKEWDKLPADIKQILITASREWCWDSLQRIHMEDLEVIARAKSKGYTDYIPVTWSDEEVAKVREVALQVWEDWTQKSAQTKKVIEAQKAFLRELGRIE